jgi:dissimilatory sulfite reductase (desulfoviridin) alpha/beta subunit
MPFVNGKIGESIIDFEDTIYFDTIWTSYSRGHARGRITDTVRGYGEPSFLWDIGRALQQEAEIKHCTFDMKECYKAKVVPVIYDISMREGYITGG